MKVCLIIFLISASNLLAGIESEIRGLKSKITEGDPRNINQSLVAIQLAINQMEPVDSPVDSPSAARIKARQKIREAIDPIIDELILLTNSNDSSVAQTATTVLGSATPSMDVYKALKENLEKTKIPGIAASSLIALSKAGLLDDEVGNIAAIRIAEYHSLANPDLALNLVRTAAFVPVPQATDQLIEILKSDERIGARMTAANAIMKLGQAGAKALPELENLLQDLLQNGGDFRDINTIKRAIMIASGGDDVSQVLASRPMEAHPMPTPQAGTPNLPKPKTSPSPSLQVEMPMSILVTWIVGAILLLTLTSGIIRKFPRK